MNAEEPGHDRARPQLAAVLRPYDGPAVIAESPAVAERFESPLFESPLDETGARELTERIKTATRQLCMLLLEAHVRRAWSALGYRTWEQYVHAEFGLSRSRSYQLLDQGRVIVIITSSANLTGTLDIHPYAAAQLKPRIGEIAEIVRERTAGRTEPEAREIVDEVIRAQRSAARPGRRGDEAPAEPPALAVAGAPADVAALVQAVSSLAGMPRARDVAARVGPRQAHQLEDLEAALGWLTEFAREWGARGRGESSGAA
jgi:hypothetical protein